jgi:AcrR family transcriptional regulator
MTPVPPKDASPQSNARDLLFAAAIKLFAHKGYDATSVKELADEAGVNISLVSYHFDGKEGLYRAVLESFGQEKLAVAERMLQPAASAEEVRIRLRMFAEEIVGSHMRHPDLFRIIHRDCELNIPVTQEIFNTRFIKVFEALVRFFSGAQKAGFVRKDLDPLIATKLYMGTLIHACRIDEQSFRHFKQSLKQPAYREQFLNQMMSTFLDGVMK